MPIHWINTCFFTAFYQTDKGYEQAFVNMTYLLLVTGFFTG
jgi:hypothetical protein